jgi:hypothetical protein
LTGGAFVAQAVAAELAGFASLLALGEAAAEIGGLHGVPFFTLASLERKLWQPAECPLGAAGTPFDPGGYRPGHHTSPGHFRVFVRNRKVRSVTSS